MCQVKIGQNAVLKSNENKSPQICADILYKILKKSKLFLNYFRRPHSSPTFCMERVQTSTNSLDLSGASMKAWLKFGLGLHESFLSLHITDQGIFFPESISKDLASVDSKAAPWCLIFLMCLKEKY